MIKMFNFIDFETKQIIQSTGMGDFDCADLMLISNLQRFVVVSKRFVFYDVYGLHQLDQTKTRNI
jgi:hypothetical protein